MVFALVLAAVGNSQKKEHNPTTMKYIPETLYLHNPDLKLNLVELGEAFENPGYVMIEKREQADLMANCPKNWFTVNKKAYNTAVTKGDTQFQVPIINTFEGDYMYVPCAPTCEDTKDAGAKKGCFVKTFGEKEDDWVKPCGDYKTDYCGPPSVDTDDTDAHYLQYCCPATCSMCTKVEIGTEIVTLAPPAAEQGKIGLGVGCKHGATTFDTKCTNELYCPKGEGKTCATRLSDTATCVVGEEPPCQMKSTCKKVGETYTCSNAFSYGFTVLAVLAAFVL